MGTAISTDARTRLGIALAQQAAGDEVSALLTLLKGQPDASQSTLVATEEDTDEWNVVGTLKDAEGNAVAKRTLVTVYLSDDDGGATLASTAAALTVEGSGDVSLGELTANHSAVLMTSTTGTFTVTIQDAGADEYYLIAVMPNGEILVSSPVMVFEA